MADFDNVSTEFIDYYDQVRGHVRERLTQENLEEYLPSMPTTALDLGGGDGRDAEWLALQGYTVTLVDPSTEMINKAEHRFRGSGLPVILMNLDSEELEKELGPQKFDVVLSHGVLMYCLDDPEAHVATISRHTKQGGLVSLLTKGFGGAQDRLVGQADAIAELEKTEQVVNNLGKLVWAFRPAHVQEMLGRHALELIEWRGVRVMSDDDTRQVDNLRHEELKQILDAERYLGIEDSTRNFGQMVHYLARKV